MRRWALPAFCGVLALMVVVQQVWISTLRENNRLLRGYVDLQTRWCEGVERVNHLCEGQFIEIMQRLGLDNEMMPLLSVSRARKMLGASEIADGFLDGAPAIGGPDEHDREAAVEVGGRQDPAP